MKMGGGAKPFGLDAERVPALARRLIAAAPNGAGSTSSRAVRRSMPRPSPIPRRRRWRLPRGWRGERRPLPHCNLGGGIGIPYFPGDDRWTSRASGRAWRTPSPRCRPNSPIPRSASNWAAIWWARRGSISPDRRPQGKPRRGVPGHRWRPAPPACRIGQLRHGGAPQLSGRHRHPVRRGGGGGSQRRRLPVHPARRAGRQGPASRAPRWAISSRCSAPAPMAPAPARPCSWGRDRRAKCSSSESSFIIVRYLHCPESGPAAN
jgi:hypothetical protein